MLLVTGTPSLVGAIDGQNVRFTAQVSLPDVSIVSINGLTRAPRTATTNGYALSGNAITLGEPLVPGDILTVYIPQAATGDTLVVQPGGVRPKLNVATVIRPTGATVAELGSVSGEATAQRPRMGGPTAGPTPGLTGAAEVI